jgi:hypothetical protein
MSPTCSQVSKQLYFLNSPRRAKAGKTEKVGGGEREGEVLLIAIPSCK